MVPDFPQQTLKAVYFVFHSGISVSTKSQINWESELTAIQAGAFGWGGTSQGKPYHDFYHINDGNTLVYSTNVNGGAGPNPISPFAQKDPPKRSGSDFATGARRARPPSDGWRSMPARSQGVARNEPTPKPDVLRIDTHKGGLLTGQNLDLENFRPGEISRRNGSMTFATTPDTQAQLGNTGNRMNFYTFSYGPYSLAPGDSVRFVLAEIAGVMDYNEVVAGDPNHHFPDSTMAAIRRNAVTRPRRGEVGDRGNGEWSADCRAGSRSSSAATVRCYQCFARPGHPGGGRYLELR